MSTRKDLLRIVRRSQTFISILLFIIVFLFCWQVTDFELTEIQLSKWGESGVTAPFWNGIVCVLAVSIFINSYLYIKHTPRIKRKNISYALFGLIALCLFIVGLFNVNYKIIHNIAAYLYFFAYPLAIFIFTYLHRTTLQYKDWVKDMTISISMIVLPLVFVALFNGMAWAETIHTSLVILWNIKLALNE